MSNIEIFNVVASLLGGLALFLFGMNNMSDSLSTLSGGILDKTLGWVTKNRFTAFLFGTILTALVQSASAVSVLTVGLVNSGIIKLGQAFGLLVGANLGTTATAWLLSLNALDGESLLMTLLKPSSFTPFLAIISVALIMFAKKDKTIRTANAILGFSVMMIGMKLMGSGVEPLENLPALQKVLMGFSNPLFGFLFAVVFTMLIQSSDATIGIIQAFALAVGVNYGMAIPLICGAQLGTCITALLSSMGASNSGKRTALMNLYYNLLKVIPFMLIFYGVNSVMHFSFLTSSVGGIGIPVCHTLINLFGSAIWLPCGSLIIALAKKTIQYSEKERREHENRLTMLDKNLLSNTIIALEQTDKAVITLANTVEQATLTMVSNDSDEETLILLERVRQFREQIDNYLAEISVRASNTGSTTFAMLLTNANAAFGEIGAILEEQLGFYTELKEEVLKGTVSESDIEHFRVLREATAEILGLAIIGFEEKDAKLSGTMQVYREELAAMSGIVKNRFILRTHKEGRSSATPLISKISRSLDRMVDSLDIVADSLIKYSKTLPENIDTAAPYKEDVRKRVRKLFMDKYTILDIGFDEEGRAIDLLQ